VIDGRVDEDLSALPGAPLSDGPAVGLATDDYDNAVARVAQVFCRDVRGHIWEFEGAGGSFAPARDLMVALRATVAEQAAGDPTGYTLDFDKSCCALGARLRGSPPSSQRWYRRCRR